MIALSVDSVDDHNKWIKVRSCATPICRLMNLYLESLQDIDEINQCTVNYPIVADHDRHVRANSAHRLCLSSPRAWSPSFTHSLSVILRVGQVAVQFGMLSIEALTETGMPLTVRSVSLAAILSPQLLCLLRIGVALRCVRCTLLTTRRSCA